MTLHSISIVSSVKNLYVRTMENQKILIVDDEREIIRSIALQLREHFQNIEIINAGNGEIACKVALKEIPNLILMDWDMPVKNGIETTKYLTTQEATRNIPIVMMTGQMTSSDDLKIALDAGATDFITKPIDFIELLARINAALRMYEQHQTIQRFMENEIALKNRRLSTASMLIVEKNTLLDTIRQQIQQLEKRVNTYLPTPVLSSEFQEIKGQIGNHTDVDNSWEVFKMHFDEVHPDFFAILTEKYKSLSIRDLKLCAYLRIGMDNHEMTKVLNISNGSVRTALFRLKKKMGLAESDNLRALMMGIE